MHSTLSPFLPSALELEGAPSRLKPAFPSLGLFAQCPEEARALLALSLTNPSLAHYSFHKAAPCSPESLPNVCGSLCRFRQCTTCHHAATDGRSSWGLSWETWAGDKYMRFSCLGTFLQFLWQRCTACFSPSPLVGSVSSGKLIPLPISQMG